MKNYKNENQKWIELLLYCDENLGLEPKLMEYLSIFLELEMTARGLSIYSIAKELDIESEDVTYDLFRSTGFVGFTVDLDINPILWYNSGRIEELTNYLDNSGLDFLKQYIIIKEKLDKYYG
jgi:hypothetical protein